jgi:hypothetical protein
MTINELRAIAEQGDGGTTAAYHVRRGALDAGDYLETWDDEWTTDPIRSAIRDALDTRGLTLRGDDQGLRVEAL